MIKKNDKVYIISKSYGDLLEQVIIRQKSRSSSFNNTVTIIHKGQLKEAHIGYYNKQKPFGESFFEHIHVLDYFLPVHSGDFYLRKDFLTEEEILCCNLLSVLDDSLFEI